MEDNELQNLWKNIDSEINLKSKDDLNQLLNTQIRKSINKFMYVICFSILVCAGLIVFLVITALNRRNDILYLINNLTLCLITLIALITSLVSWYKLQNNKFDQPLKDWLEERINLLTKQVTGKYGKVYLYLIPVIFTLMLLSIHVYFENKSFLEVFNTGESIIGLIVSAPIGLIISYYGASKIRKYHLKNLELLKGVHGRLCNPG